MSGSGNITTTEQKEKQENTYERFLDNRDVLLQILDVQKKILEQLELITGDKSDVN